MRDDRGQDVQPVGYGELKGVMREAGLHRAFSKGLGRRVPVWMGVLLALPSLMVAVGVVLLLGLLLASAIGLDVDGVSRVLGPFLGSAPMLGLLGVAVMLPIYERVRKRGRFVVAVELGRCGGCGYALDEALAEPDGCVVCPECGAAWRLGRAGGAGGADA